MSIAQIATDPNTWVGLFGLGTVVRVGEKVVKVLAVLPRIGRVLVRIGTALNKGAEIAEDVQRGDIAEAAKDAAEAVGTADVALAPIVPANPPAPPLG